MTQENFVYWLQGAIELGKMTKMDEQQIQILKDHLALVMTKVTTTYPASPLTWPQTIPLQDLNPMNPFGQGQIICSTELPPGSVMCQGGTGTVRVDNLAGGSIGTLTTNGGVSGNTASISSNANTTFTSDSTASTLECAKPEPTLAEVLEKIKEEMREASKSKIDRDIFGGYLIC